MKTARTALALVLAVLVLAPIGAAAQESHDVSPAGARLWEAMEPYQQTWLRRYLAGTRMGEPTDHDVLLAFNDLAYQITGPGGLWRKDAPNQWWGCRAMPAQPACEVISGLGEEWRRWDALQQQIEGVRSNRAAAFIARNERALVRYLKHYVPRRDSAFDAEATPFHQKHLDGLVGSGLDALLY